MKKESVKGLFKKVSVKAGSLVLAAAILVGGSVWYQNSNQVPELVTYVDSEETVSISEDETPLAAPKVTKSTKTTKSTKNIKLKKASKKTYTQTGKTTKKTTTKKTSNAKQTTTTKTETATSVSNKFTKGSKIQKQTTTVKTTITKTVVAKAAAAGTTATAKNGTVSVTSIAPKVDKRVSNAFNKLGFKVKINSGVSYSGLMDARTRTITLKKSDATVYHELGHFVAFVAGNVDTTASFKSIYNKEKSKYTAYNKAYVLSSSSEYFAESFKNYVENPAALKKARPQTYAAIQSALNKITDSQVNKIAKVYKAVWK